MTTALPFAIVTCELARLMFQDKLPLESAPWGCQDGPGLIIQLNKCVFQLHNICITTILEATQAIPQFWSFPS